MESYNKSFKYFYLYMLRGIGLFHLIVLAYEKRHPDLSVMIDRLRVHRYHVFIRVFNAFTASLFLLISYNYIEYFWNKLLIFERINHVVYWICSPVTSLLAVGISVFIAVFISSLIFYRIMTRDSHD